MKATKIVCTLGPASSDKQVIKEMLAAGMNVARFNFSHGSHEEHQEKMNTFRQACREMEMPAAVLLDTKGPGGFCRRKSIHKQRPEIRAARIR